MSKMIHIAVGSLVAAGFAFSGAMAAETKLHATMNAASEVPANGSKGTGTAEVTVNDATKEVTYSVTFSGLTGDATASHIHGPAAPGANAGVMVNFGAGPLKSPITGKATVTDAQIADILAGKAYVNVHTAMNKGGEIRGQLMK